MSMLNEIRSQASKLIKYLLLLAAVGVALYWVRFAPLEVNGVRISQGEIIAEVMGSGTLEAQVQTVVSSKIPGRISEIFVDQGDQVKEGSLLARLDDKDLKQQVEIARSAQSAAQASIERFQAEVNRASAVLEQARSEHRRHQKLYSSKSISSNEIGKSEQVLAVAEADLARSKAAVIEARKNLLVAQNTLDYHLARLHDTVIRAPFDGLIIRRDREPGDVVVPGTSIFLVISTDGLWVKAWVDETEMSKVAPGQGARVLFRSEPDRAYPGRVARLARETDRETRQFIVDVEVNELPRNWAVGQRADIFIRVGRNRGAVLLPSGLIVRRQENVGVFVERAGRVEWRPVKLGIQGRDRIEVLEGLSPGDTVIEASESGRLNAGRRVAVGYHEPGR